METIGLRLLKGMWLRGEGIKTLKEWFQISGPELRATRCTTSMMEEEEKDQHVLWGEVRSQR